MVEGSATAMVEGSATAHLEHYCKGSNPLCATIIRSLLGTLTAATIREAV